MQKKAWTLAELVIAVAAIALIASVIGKGTKPDYNKTKLFSYYTMENILRGNSAVIDKYGQLDDDERGADNAKNKYCSRFADFFTTKGNILCNNNMKRSVANITLQNNVTIQGLATKWYLPYPGAPYEIKNIVFDIDGRKGRNKLWVDRIPLRMYRGGVRNGQIQLVDCSNQVVYKPDGSEVVLDEFTGRNPYCCDSGFDSNERADNCGESNEENKSNTKSIITYDVFRVDLSEEGEISQSGLIAGDLSPKEADCMAYGGTGLYHAEECYEDRYHLSEYCATADLCKSCKVDYDSSLNVCPKNSAGAYTNPTTCLDVAKTKNTHKELCFTRLHKPTVGVGLLFGPLLNSMGI